MLSSTVPFLIASLVASFALLAMFYRSRTPRRIRRWNREDEQAFEGAKNSEKPGENLFSDFPKTSTRKRT